MQAAKAILLFLLVMPGMLIFADDLDDRKQQELARQEAFLSGFQVIVESLNLGSFDLFVSSIDRDDFLDRIFGLRLIDPRLKRDFREQMQLQFASLVESGPLICIGGHGG